MPRLRNARSSSFDDASSSSGPRCGSASTIVTSTPKDFQALANSTPMTPPPSTTVVSVTVVRGSTYASTPTRSADHSSRCLRSSLLALRSVPGLSRRWKILTSRG